MPADEAEYMRSIELNGLGRGPWTNFRIRIMKYGTRLPSYQQLVTNSASLKYPIIEFFGGWRAKLQDLVEVKSLLPNYQFQCLSK